MHSHSGTLHPMLGVGAFMTMFWTGVIVGHELGVACVTLRILGLLFGCIASVGVCELQRRERQGLAAGTRESVPGPGRPAGGADARGRAAAGTRSPLGPVTIITSAPVGSS